MKNILHRIPFKFQIFFGCLLVALIPLLFSGIFMVRVFDASLSRQSAAATRLQAAEAGERVDQLFSACEAAGRELIQSKTAYRTMIDNTTVEYQKDLYLSLYQSAQKTQSYARFSIYDAGGLLRFTTEGSSPIAEKLPVNWGLLRKAARTGSGQGTLQTVYYRTDPYLSENPNLLFQAACPLENPQGARAGYLVLDFTREDLSRLLHRDYPDKDTYLFLDHLGEVVYCSREELGAEEIQQIISQARNSSHTGRFFYASTGNPEYGYTILLQKDAQISAAGIKTMNTVSFFIALFGLWLCLAVSLALSRNISSPVSRLDRAMKKVREGDLSVRLTTRRKDELGRLIDSFNRMTQELKDNLDTAIKRQQDLNETTLKLYQTQLNPHFLYNTLDTIKWNAKINHNPQIPVLAENLAQILRSSISSEPFITLCQELKNIECYVEIQKIRFTERFLYEEEIPWQLEHCLVPKMILQPLVENAILHGLEDCSQGYLCIYARKTNDGQGSILQISVTDNGKGMSREMLEWVNTPGSKKRDGHLGLFNVIQILKLHYGQEYGLRAQLNPEGGTTVTLRLPAKFQEV